MIKNLSRSLAILMIVMCISFIVPTNFSASASEPTSTLRVASINALGFSHTVPGGNSYMHTDGRVRVRLMIRTINYRKPDIIGFQEFQPPQQKVWRALMGKKWGLYCANQGAHDNCIAWRRAVVHILVRSHLTIPYFYGKPRWMPLAMFKIVKTGQKFWFYSAHNPATGSKSGEGKYKWRVAGWEIENRMYKAKSRNYPVLSAADKNQTAPGYLPYLPSFMRAARAHGIDWILGDKAHVTFPHARKLRTKLIKRWTDHPVIIAVAHITS